jgi:hypothetical protein
LYARASLRTTCTESEQPNSETARNKEDEEYGVISEYREPDGMEEIGFLGYGADGSGGDKMGFD